MKKFIEFILKCSLVAIIFVAVSCETEEEVKSDINKLKATRSEVQKELNRMQSTIAPLKERTKELKKISEGETPEYILKIKLKQSHFTLDIGKHIKDAANAIEFELPVSEKFYKSVNVGTKIVDEFRYGSLFLSNSIGDWEMTVVGKKIK